MKKNDFEFEEMEPFQKTIFTLIVLSVGFGIVLFFMFLCLLIWYFSAKYAV